MVVSRPKLVSCPCGALLLLISAVDKRVDRYRVWCQRSLYARFAGLVRALVESFGNVHLHSDESEAAA